jgi:isopenicillin-N epimerase
MIGAMVSLPLPDATTPAPPEAAAIDPLQDALMDRHRIEVPIFPWPSWPRRCVRVTAQAYNTLADYEKLGRALAHELSAR